MIVLLNKSRLSLFAMVFLLLPACSTFQKTLENSTLADFRKNVQIQQWEIWGRIGIRDKNQADSANLNWRQCDDKFDIRISGPLALGAVHLYGDSKHTTFKKSGEPPQATDDPEQMLIDMGWSIPVNALFDWVRGLPNSSQDFVIDNENTGFTQTGWKVLYPKTYSIDQFIVPAKAIIEKGGKSVV